VHATSPTSQERLAVVKRSIILRIAAGSVCGLIAGSLLADSIRVGMLFLYRAEEARTSWGFLMWGEHWVLRGLTSVSATIWAAFLAGIAARRYGGLAACIGSLPATLVWLTCAVIAWQRRELFSMEFRFLATLLPIVIPILAFRIGGRSAGIGQRNGDHFDSRRWTLFGIKWVHYLWIPFLFHIIVIESVWAIIRGAVWLVESLAAGVGFSAVLPGISFAAMFWTLILIRMGLSRGYLVLAGFRTASKGTGRAVLKYAVGWPAIAIAIQSGILGVHYLVGR